MQQGSNADFNIEYKVSDIPRKSCDSDSDSESESSDHSSNAVLSQEPPRPKKEEQQVILCESIQVF